MALLVAVLLALFVLPRPWGWVAVGVAVVYEVASTSYAWHWSRSRRQVVGPAALVGAVGEVTDDCRPDGWVRLGGELWRARCAGEATAGARVRVRAVEGIVLLVEPDEMV